MSLLPRFRWWPVLCGGLAACAARDPVVAPPMPSAIELVDGANQTGTAGYRLGQRVRVRVKDVSGNPVAGVPVIFTPAEGSGRAEPDTSWTNPQGIAFTNWRLGGAGAQQLGAKVEEALGTLTIAAQGGSRSVRAIAGGTAGLCAVDEDGRLDCWATPMRGLVDPAAFAVLPELRFTAVAAAQVSNGQLASTSRNEGGTARVCATTVGGRIWCFTLVDGVVTGAPAELPGAYPALTRIAATPVRMNGGAATGHAFCALTADGAAWCWGRNAFGEAGDGTTATRTEPVRVQTDARFVRIFPGRTTCGLTADDVAWCWGYNTHGSAGASGTDRLFVPTPLSTPIRFRHLVLASEVELNCGIAVAGGLYCWGDRSSWPRPLPDVSSPEPRSVPGFETMTGFGAMSAAMVGLDGAGGAKLWGSFQPIVDGGTSTPTASRMAWSLREFVIPGGANLNCGTHLTASGIFCVTLSGAVHHPDYVYGVPFFGIPPRP